MKLSKNIEIQYSRNHLCNHMDSNSAQLNACNIKQPFLSFVLLKLNGQITAYVVEFWTECFHTKLIDENAFC